MTKLKQSKTNSNIKIKQDYIQNENKKEQQKKKRYFLFFLHPLNSIICRIFFYLQKSYFYLNILLFSSTPLVTILSSLLFFAKIGNNKESDIFRNIKKLMNYKTIIKFIIVTNTLIQTFSYNKLYFIRIN